MTALTVARPRSEIALLQAGVTHNGALASREFCQEVLARWEAANVPCGGDEASKIGQLILAAYPTVKAHSPEQYAALVRGTIARYPAVVAKEAAERVVRKKKFPPTVADIEEALAEVYAEKAKIARTAKAHLDERMRRESEEIRGQERERDRQALRETLGPAWDDWWQVPIARRYTGTPEEFARGWTQAADKAAFIAAWGGETQTAGSAE